MYEHGRNYITLINTKTLYISNTAETLKCFLLDKPFSNEFINFVSSVLSQNLLRTVVINNRKVSISQINTVFPMKNNLLIPVKITLVKWRLLAYKTTKSLTFWICNTDLSMSIIYPLTSSIRILIRWTQ